MKKLLGLLMAFMLALSGLLPSFASGVTSGNVNIQNGKATFTLKGGESILFDHLPAGLKYKITERHMPGWLLKSKENDVGFIKPSETVVAKFVNKYSPNEVTAIIEGSKTLDGKPADNFEFGLYEGDREISKAKSIGGKFSFDPILYKEAGLHTYTIKELGQSEFIEYDKHVETVKVDVKDDGNGNLSANVIYDQDKASFYNKTKYGRIEVSKTVEGRTNDNTEFKFRLSLNDGQKVEEFSLKSGQNKVFENLTPGSKYKIEEVDTPIKYTSQLENAEGVVGPSSDIKVRAINTYQADGLMNIVASKRLEGGNLLGNDFEFELYGPDNKLIATEKNNSAGNITFTDIKLTKTGEFVYKIREKTNINDPNVIVDTDEKIVKANVTNDNGVLKAKLDYGVTGKAEFVNKVKSGKLEISKKVTGTNLKGDFTFTMKVLDRDKKEVHDSFKFRSNRGKNGQVTSGVPFTIKAGEVLSFDDIPIGSQVSIIEESAPGYTMDTEKSVDKVTIEDAEKVHKLSIINNYKAKVSFIPKAKKTFYGGSFKDYSFEFIMLNEEDEFLDRASNDLDGNVEFSPIEYTSDDIGKTFIYKFSEINNKLPNIYYDRNQFKLKVTISDNGDGTLKVNQTITNGPLNLISKDHIEFLNYYDSVPVTGTKGLMAIIFAVLTLILGGYLFKYYENRKKLSE